MDIRSQKVKTTFLFITFILQLSLKSSATTWVGSKYQIECTMCAACDNPCNQQPPPLYPPPPPQPPSTSTGTGSGYYYSPPTTTTGTGGGYYYTPPPPSPQGYYLNPGPPNPVTNYFPYYYHNSPPYASATLVSLSNAIVTVVIVLNILLLF